MAAEWYYSDKVQQKGPIELAQLQSMLAGGALSSGDMIFGPGMTQWTQAGMVAELVAAPVATVAASPVAGGMLSYRGIDTDTTGLSSTALEFLRQTKPWARFLGIMTFIMCGFMTIGAASITVVGVSSRRGAAGLEMYLGAFYFVVALINIVPGILLNRYASRIGDVMRNRGMTDVEAALKAQKSFFRFIGIALIVLIVLYLLAIALAAIFGLMR